MQLHSTDVIGDLMDLWIKKREEIASYSDGDLMARLEKHWRPTDQQFTGFYDGTTMPERVVSNSEDITTYISWLLCELHASITSS